MNNKCIYCNQEFSSRVKKSKEHITLKALGGKQFSYNVLCRDCNNKFGQLLDAHFIKKWISLYNIFSNKSCKVRLKKSSTDFFYNVPFDEDSNIIIDEEITTASNVFQTTPNGITGHFLSSKEAEKAIQQKISKYPNMSFKITKEPIYKPIFEININFDAYYYAELLKMQIEYEIGINNKSFEDLDIGIELFRSLKISGTQAEFDTSAEKIVPTLDSIFPEPLRYHSEEIYTTKGKTTIDKVPRMGSIGNTEWVQLALFGTLKIIYPVLSSQNISLLFTYQNRDI